MIENTSTRQQKVARQIQKDMGEIILREGAPFTLGTMVSVTQVRVSPDFELAKIYLSVFPFEKGKDVLATFDANNWLLRKTLGARLRNQLKKIPEITFHLDDSLEYAANIDRILK